MLGALLRVLVMHSQTTKSNLVADPKYGPLQVVDFKNVLHYIKAVAQNSTLADMHNKQYIIALTLFDYDEAYHYQPL